MTLRTVYLYSDLVSKPIFRHPLCPPPKQSDASPSSSSSSSSSSSFSSSDDGGHEDKWPCHNHHCRKIWGLVLMAKRSKGDRKVCHRGGLKKLNKKEACRRKVESHHLQQFCEQCRHSCLTGQVKVHRRLVRRYRKQRRGKC